MELFFVITATECGVVTSPGVYLREDPVCGTQLENQSELRAPTAERAAYLLDAAIAGRTVSGAFDLPMNFCFATKSLLSDVLVEKSFPLTMNVAVDLTSSRSVI